MVTEYEHILQEQISASVFVLVICAVLAVVFVLLNRKKFLDDLGKWGKALVNIFIVIAVVSATVHFSLRIYRLNQDIQDQSYITYYGEFYVSEYKEGSVTLSEGEDKITLSGKCDLPGGTYKGTIVYSKRSKYLVDWSAGGH